ncbi:hypothetical protein [Candidatus Albibeggiatoa sp. nov. NOAA]|uniref:hypothetical protein n=1 Tax=Candidatus Albibeggiatoa sp. nov. NOAA TaxID=3162724 RepID=UPI0032F2C544|nr:hypothetical protein [Thiotrichaceae bacterium]
MPKFIVERNTEILNDLQWREGIVLYNQTFHATATIKADYNDKHIQIWVSGQQKRDYFATIRKTLHDIHNTFEKMEVTELVPLPDTDRRGETVYETYEDLIGLYEMGEDRYVSGKLKQAYSVKQLLDGIEDITQYVRSSNTINIHSASSSNINIGSGNHQTIKH